MYLSDYEFNQGNDMNKSELRKARKQARAGGRPLDGELKLANVEGSYQEPKPVKKYKVKMDWTEWYARHR